MSIGRRIVAGFAWTSGGRFLSQLVAWIVSIVVVRILTPSDYGLLAMAVVLTGFIGLFAELGLGWALVQARHVDTPTLRGLFGLVILVNGILFALVFSVAPLVADFFAEPGLIDIIRVLAIKLLIGVPAVVPDAMLQRDLEFKWRSVVELTAAIAGAAATLAFALTGYGVWSLVYGGLVGVTWRSAGLNLIHPFLHPPSFAFRGLGRLFRFGGYVAISRALLYTYLQADMVIGGRFLGKEQLGYYSVGMQLASLPLQRVSAILNEVAFPAIARIQDERERIGSFLVSSIGLLGLFAFPIFWGIAAVAPEIVSVFLGSKWEPATLPLQLLALVMPLRMIGQLMPPTLQGTGKASLAARNQLLACCAMTVAFLVGVRFGIVGLSLAWVLVYPLVFAAQLTTWLPVAGIRARQLMFAIGRPAIAGTAMFAAVAAARILGVSSGPYALLALAVIGAAVYVALSLIVNADAVRDARSLVRRAREPFGAPR